jgi:hypothetical protein
LKVLRHDPSFWSSAVTLGGTASSIAFSRNAASYCSRPRLLSQPPISMWRPNSARHASRWNRLSGAALPNVAAGRQVAHLGIANSETQTPRMHIVRRQPARSEPLKTKGRQRRSAIQAKPTMDDQGPINRWRLNAVRTEPDQLPTGRNSSRSLRRHFRNGSDASV